MAFLFESETCSRCRGSGHYSFCERYGTRCFKCAGAKIVLTKRGAAAQGYLAELQTKVVSDLQPGDLIECSSVTHGGTMYRYKAPVVSITPANINATINEVPVEYVTIRTEHVKFGSSGLQIAKTSSVRVWPSTPENVAKALDYQANLTKAGKTRKGKKA